VAWSEQAWRYSIGNVVDPSVDLDNEQTHYALAGFPFPQVGFTGDIAGTLGAFTAEIQGTFSATGGTGWDLEDRLAVAYIPLPDSGFTDNTRLTIGGAPGVEAVVGNDREGDIVATLSDFTADFDGTVVNPIIDGDLNPAISAFSTSFLGEHYYNHFFEGSYSVTTTTVYIEEPARFGDLVPTISTFVSGFTGNALPISFLKGCRFLDHNIRAGLTLFRHIVSTDEASKNHERKRARSIGPKRPDCKGFCPLALLYRDRN